MVERATAIDSAPDLSACFALRGSVLYAAEPKSTSSFGFLSDSARVPVSVQCGGQQALAAGEGPMHTRTLDIMHNGPNPLRLAALLLLCFLLPGGVFLLAVALRRQLRDCIGRFARNCHVRASRADCNTDCASAF